MARPAMPKPSVFGSGGGTTTVDLTEPAPARFRSPRRLAASIVRVVWGGRLSTLLLWCSFVTSLTGSPCSAKHAAHFLALRGMPFGPFTLRYSFGDAPDPGQKPNANRFMAHIGHVCGSPSLPQQMYLGTSCNWCCVPFFAFGTSSTGCRRQGPRRTPLCEPADGGGGVFPFARSRGAAGAGTDREQNTAPRTQNPSWSLTVSAQRTRLCSAGGRRGTVSVYDQRATQGRHGGGAAHGLLVAVRGCYPATCTHAIGAYYSHYTNSITRKHLAHGRSGR